MPTQLPGPAFRVVFAFSDPEGVAPSLIKRFRQDRELQTFIDARRVITEAMDHVRRAGLCELRDIDHEIELIGEPWGDPR